MKKIFLALIIPAIIGVSCNSSEEADKKGHSAMAQKNLDAMHGVMECFDTKDFSKLSNYIAEDAIDHAGEQGDIVGLDSMKAAFTKMAANFDDQKTEIIKELADDEYVMCWAHYSGTIKADGMGYKAGDKYSMSSLEVAKFKDGKAVEHWAFMEPAEMMKMMGNMPPPMPADTTKKM